MTFVACTAGAVLAACAGHGRVPPTTTEPTLPPATTTTPPPPSPPVAPLTGLPVTDAAVLTRPAVVVKIDNAPEARPQTGLARADVIIEERVEGGIARFMALFQSADADVVGPVRSVRSTDPPVVRPIGGLFAYSGGIPPFVSLLHTEGGVVDVGANVDGSAYYRSKDRPAPHNLYTSTVVLRQKAPAGLPAPPTLFTFLPAGRRFTGARAVPLSHFSVTLGSLSSGQWDWDPTARSWLRSTDGTPHLDQGSGQLAFTTVIIQFVPYARTPYKDPARSPVDEAEVIGAGAAWVLADGQLVQGTWSKPTVTDVTTFADSAGAPIAIPPGHTWITLAPLTATTSLGTPQNGSGTQPRRLRLQS